MDLGKYGRDAGCMVGMILSHGWGLTSGSPRPYTYLKMRIPTRRDFCAAIAGSAAAASAQSRPRPNIVFVLTDDQGYGDIAAHGNPVIKTPNLDRLYGESVRFTDFHASPTCAPTRTALMTGRHEFKSGVTHTILERERMSLKSTTIAQVLRAAGYATGIFGKWHLGDAEPYQPGQRGFEETFIHGCGGIGQDYPGTCADAPGNTYFDPVIRHNGRFERTHGYCSDVFFGRHSPGSKKAKTRASLSSPTSRRTLPMSR
jgi:hypothetical protein